jgi:Na+/H+ antiporter NhaA
VLAIDFDGNRIEPTLREWVNSGLMTFFFGAPVELWVKVIAAA